MTLGKEERSQKTDLKEHHHRHWQGENPTNPLKSHDPSPSTDFDGPAIAIMLILAALKRSHGP